MKHTLLCIPALFLVAAIGWSAGTQEAAGTVDYELSAPGEFPLVEPQVTLTFLAPDRGTVEYEYEKNHWTRYAQDKTNVKIDLRLVPEGQEEMEKVRLLIAAKDFPDVYFGIHAMTKDTLLEWGSQGILQPLEDLIAEHAPNTQRIFFEIPEARGAVTAPDGHIYSLFQINECFHCSMSKKMWINRKWMQALDLEMPQTTEEFSDVLEAFRDEDPNGNGEADEIPLIGYNDGWYSQPWEFLMNAFIDFSFGFRRVENGRVEFAPIQPEWREGLRYVHELYEAGLLEKNSFTNSRDQVRAIIAETPWVVGATSAGYPGDFGANRGYNKENGLDDVYTTVPALEGPTGFRASHFSPSLPSVGAYVISASTDHPELAMKYGDMFLDPTSEITLRSWYGPPRSEVEGGKWDWPDEGQIGINGKPAVWQSIRGGDVELANAAWQMNGYPIYMPASWRLGVARQESLSRYHPNNLELLLYEETKNNYEPYVPDEYWINPWFTKEQLDEMKIAGADVETIVTEHVARFVTGELDIDSDDDWNSYVKLFDRTGLDRWLEISQEAYAQAYGSR